MFRQTVWIGTVEVNWDAGLVCLSRLEPRFPIHLHDPHPPHPTVVLKHWKWHCLRRVFTCVEEESYAFSLFDPPPGVLVDLTSGLTYLSLSLFLSLSLSLSLSLTLQLSCTLSHNLVFCETIATYGFVYKLVFLEPDPPPQKFCIKAIFTIRPLQAWLAWSPGK